MDLAQATSSHLLDLNPPQLEAVTHHRGPILILAGAGSGKTRVLTRRIANLVLDHRETPGSILAVTFTNKAAAEMKERIHSLMGGKGEEVWVATFHSASLRILRRHAKLLDFTNDFVVYDDQDSKSLMKRLLKERGIDDKKNPPSSFLGYIDRAKNSFVLPPEAKAKAGSLDLKLKAQIYEEYQNALHRANAMDFGDLLVHSVRLFKECPQVLELYQRHIRYVLVDEFQDTNKVQYLFIRLLAGAHQNLLVVGDDDQSIYAFRGASIENILNFERDFPDTKVVKLEENYRSTSTILDAAHSIIGKNKNRKAKKLWTKAGSGSKIVTYVASSEGEEADFVAREIISRVRAGLSYSSVAVFYRTNAQSRAIEEAFMLARIPYRIFGGLKFYDRKEVKDILSYLRFLLNPFDPQAFTRIINTPPRGIGNQTTAHIERFAGENSCSYLEACRKIGQTNKPTREFVALLDELKKGAAELALGTLIGEIIEKTRYAARIKASEDPQAQSRIENLKELQAIGAQMERPDGEAMETIALFLDRVSLTSSADLPEDERKERSSPSTAVSMMTLHLAKGLEFPVVFLTGLEEGLLPHYRSLESDADIEEERRLCYVGITRAMKQLILTRSVRRSMFSAGQSFGTGGLFRQPSRFIDDLSEELLEQRGQPFSDSGGAESDDGAYRYETDDHFESRPASRFGPRSSSPVARTSVSLPKLRTAEELRRETGAEDKNRPLLDAEELRLGLAVNHPVFGDGSITELEGDPVAAPGEVRVTVQFEREKTPKRLNFRFARLAKAE